MGGGMMRGLWTHCRIRLVWTIRSPVSLAMLLCCALATLVFWPAPGRWAGPWSFGTERASPPAVLTFLWMFGWPAFAARAVGGSASRGVRLAYMIGPLPALPIGPRTRALAEALAVLTAVLVAQLPFLATGAMAPSHSAFGALLALPLLVGLGLLVREGRGGAPRGVVTAGTIVGLAAAIQAGTITRPGEFVAVSVLLTALFLWWTGRESRALFRGPAGAARPVSHRHASGPPQSRLLRDLWLRPLPALAILLSIETVVLLVDVFHGLPRTGFYAVSVGVFACMVPLVAMRPLGSNLIARELALGFVTPRNGSFCAAWTVLPLRRETLLRGVYLHSLISGTAILTLLFGTLLLKSWLDAGRPGAEPWNGHHEGWFYLPLVAGLPCLAGAMTSAAVGDRSRARISIASGFGVVFGYAGCQFLQPPAPLLAALLVVLALSGGVPPLIHLRSNGRLRTDGRETRGQSARNSA